MQKGFVGNVKQALLFLCLNINHNRIYLPLVMRGPDAIF